MSKHILTQEDIIYDLKMVNEKNAQAYYILVVFDMLSREVLFTKKYVTGGMGFGFRNYWAKSYYDLIKDYAGYDMRNWLKKAKRKRK